MDEDFDLKFDRKLSKFLRRARFVIRLACFLIVAYIGYTVAMSGRDYRENSMSPKIKYYLSGFGIEDEHDWPAPLSRPASLYFSFFYSTMENSATTYSITEGSKSLSGVSPITRR